MAVSVTINFPEGETEDSVRQMLEGVGIPEGSSVSVTTLTTTSLQVSEGAFVDVMDIQPAPPEEPPANGEVPA